MVLYLIRHGKSIANERQLVTGSTNDVLSQDGIIQVEELRDWLCKNAINGNYYITSQWVRAQQTAQILWPGVKWEIDAKIGETDAGEVSEWKLTDFLFRYPDFYTSPSNCYPEGESHDDLNVRSIMWLNEMLKRNRNDEGVVLVAHSGPISCLLQHVTNVSMENFPAFRPSNASLSIIHFPDNTVENAAIKGFSLRSNL